MGLFLNKPYSLPYTVARALAQLCCHMGTLPQGAPTSPIISNLICGSLDSKLKSLARLYSCTYTRYADDLTFSTDLAAFPASIAVLEESLWHVGEELTKLIEGETFSINKQKTTMRARGACQIVTGLVVN